MNKKLLSGLLLLMLASVRGYSQSYFQQYFDGADTNRFNSIFIKRDTSSTNCWQVGKPQKVIFNRASTLPNAMMTDTVNPYPINNTSSFEFAYKAQIPQVRVIAVRWMQKLDLDTGLDGGIVEFSVDTGHTWQNAFNNPNVYNFYGFQPRNKDTLANGQVAFSGQDTSWRDIWFCFDGSWLASNDSLRIRFTLKSDSVNNSSEGWMIDNLRLQQTFAHTIKQAAGHNDLRIYPTETTGIVHIETEKTPEFHIIEHMTLTDASGRVVQQYGMCPAKYFIDLSALSDGIYYLSVKTNTKTKTSPILLRRPG